MDFLDPRGFAVQNRNKELKFAQSARKHQVGRARVKEVLLAPSAARWMTFAPGSERKLILVGADSSGRVLEIIVVVTTDLVLVIHAMDLRKKWRWLYDSQEEDSRQ